ncbi:hypothetical protein [Rhodopila globiformis]|uniref:hypothetical protein n=1 Tax=Rhodopila globiformis TaxID=1071 RepID=UPI001EFE299E|nr:hypothetical protein [Rhodopila globiformis]
MSDVAISGGVTDVLSARPHLDARPNIGGAIAFLLVLATGLGYAALHLPRYQHHR